MKIIFTDTTGTNLEQPKPASKLVPDWYKNMESYLDGIKKPDGSGITSGTIKRCMPVFDAITVGYIIESPADVWVSLRDGIQYVLFIVISYKLVRSCVFRNIHNIHTQNTYVKTNIKTKK